MPNSPLLHPTYLFWQKHLALLSTRSTISVIDYGCGNGVLIDVLGKHNLKSYYGLDTSRDAIMQAKLQYGALDKVRLKHIYPDYKEDLGKPKKTDIFILIGVLQYLTDQEIRYIISQAKKVLKPGGRLIFSTVLDTPLYVFLNAYRFVFPNRYINRSKLSNQLKRSGFKLELDIARGLIIGPLVSHGLVIPFDALDHYLLGVRGKIGPFGRLVRWLFFPLMYLELLIPINYGYTWYVSAHK